MHIQVNDNKVQVSGLFLCVRACVSHRCPSQEKVSDGVVLMLLANKLDLADSQRRQVTAEQGQMLAQVRLFWICKLL